jgi:hypothetical protein
MRGIGGGLILMRPHKPGEMWKATKGRNAQLEQEVLPELVFLGVPRKPHGKPHAGF